jgi:hypothetical protein
MYHAMIAASWTSFRMAAMAVNTFIGSLLGSSLTAKRVEVGISMNLI